MADALEVGPSFVQTCLEVVAELELARGTESAGKGQFPGAALVFALVRMHGTRDTATR